MTFRDEYGNPEAFYTEAQPCESCGEPTSRPRVWDAEYDLWVAVDCDCNVPSVPTCPALIPLLERANTVREVCRVIRQHRATCELCGPRQMPIPNIRKEAA